MAKQVTDTQRMDWLTEHKAALTYQSSKVGAGWVREEAWFVEIGRETVSRGESPRAAIDRAVHRKGEQVNGAAAKRVRPEER